MYCNFEVDLYYLDEFLWWQKPLADLWEETYSLIGYHNTQIEYDVVLTCYKEK